MTYGYFGGKRASITDLPNGIAEPRTLPDAITSYKGGGVTGSLELRGRVILRVRGGRYVARYVYSTADDARHAMTFFKAVA